MQSAAHATESLIGPLNEVERKHAPKELYIAGDAELLTTHSRVAIVGSRGASPIGLQRAQGLARALVRSGVVVVSGLADGIDTAAHGAAIDAGGRTIAVLGTPLDKTYPAKNRDLQARIMRDHLAISQFAPGTKTQPAHFPMRNRTMALVSEATVIVEAGAKSGTENQGWEALRLGKLLFLMQSLVDLGLPWTNELLRYGAQVLTRENLPEMIADLPQRARGDALAF